MYQAQRFHRCLKLREMSPAVPGVVLSSCQVLIAPWLFVYRSRPACLTGSWQTSKEIVGKKAVYEWYTESSSSPEPYRGLSHTCSKPALGLAPRIQRQTGYNLPIRGTHRLEGQMDMETNNNCNCSKRRMGEKLKIELNPREGVYQGGCDCRCGF